MIDMIEPVIDKAAAILEEIQQAPATSSGHCPSRKKNSAEIWTEQEDQLLFEACTLFGNQWNTVAPYVGRDKDECMKRWKTLIPENWKSFTNIAWPDVDILLLIEAVHQSKYDHSKGGFRKNKVVNWLLVATLMNEDDWLYNSGECYQTWWEVQEMAISRMGDFTAVEDSIILRRAQEWGKSQHGKWQQLSGELKRDYRQLNGRWRALTNYKAPHNILAQEEHTSQPVPAPPVDEYHYGKEGDKGDEGRQEAEQTGISRKRPISRKCLESAEVFY